VHVDVAVDDHDHDEESLACSGAGGKMGRTRFRPQGGAPMPFGRLEEVERRDRWDLIVQWFVIVALIAGLVVIVKEVGLGI
jgi:hypothetical protein